MSTPIIESIAEFIKDAINTITVANGFNQTLKAIRPKRLYLNNEITDDLSVVIVQEKPIENEATATTRSWKQPFVIQAIIIDSDNETASIDTRLNQVRSDIEKKLCEDKKCGGNAEYLKINSPDYIEPSEAFTGIVVNIEVYYTVEYNDPYVKA